MKLANSQKSAGTGTGIEVTRAQVQLANDRQRLVGGAESSANAPTCSCSEALGLRLDGEVELTDQAWITSRWMLHRWSRRIQIAETRTARN